MIKFRDKTENLVRRDAGVRNEERKSFEERGQIDLEKKRRNYSLI